VVLVFKNTHKFLEFQRKSISGAPIETKPQELFFTVKTKTTDEKPLIQKTLTSGDFYYMGNGVWRITILPQDTATLPFGIYKADVKVIDESGLNFIIVPPVDFKVADVVTTQGG
jgi:hypothetical protein